MEQAAWYLALAKPDWAPPASVFGPVWTVLYLVMAVTYWQAWRLYRAGSIPFRTLLPFVLNLVSNLAFTPLQMGLGSLSLAMADLVLVWVTLAWALFAIRRTAPWIAYANLPYLLWVTFAGFLQYTILRMN